MSEVNTSTKTTRRPDGAALVIALVLAALAALIFWDVDRLGEVVGYSPVGPATVPKWIAFGLAGLAVWTVFAAFRRDFPEREHQEISPVAWVVGGLAAQMLLISHLGFAISTGVLFAATARAFGKRQLWLSVPVGIVLSFAIWVVFSRFLQLSLPAGPLERLVF